MLKKITFLLSLSCVPFAYAQDITIIDEEVMPYSSTDILYTDPSGVTVNLNSDGSIKSIMSTGEAELIIGDRKDIRTSLQKAEMRAKASIAKFISESITSTQTLDEITETVTSANSNGDSVATRDSIEKTTESISNSANEVLKGVITLLQDVDNENKFVMVTVGINENTLQASNAIKNGIAKENITTTNNSQKIEASNKREVRKSKMMDDF